MCIRDRNNTPQSARLGGLHDLLRVEFFGIEYRRIGVAVSPFLVFVGRRREMDQPVLLHLMPFELAR